MNSLFKMRTVLIVSLFLCLYSCNESNNKNKKSKIPEQTIAIISKTDISKLKFTEFILDDKAKRSLESWEKYFELNTIVNNAKQADFSFFTDNNEIILAFIKDIKSSIPDTVNTPLILARLIALETKMLKLEAVLNFSNQEKKETLLLLKEFFVSFSNLNFQINKKFEKESQNIQKPY